jgi:hypothetical protein
MIRLERQRDTLTLTVGENKLENPLYLLML